MGDIQTRKKVLIIGASGQIGGALLDTISKDNKFQAKGTGRTASGSLVSLDITDKEKVKFIFKSLDPDIVILTAAYSHVDGVEQKREYAYSVNVEGVQTVAELCARHGAKLIFFSSAYIFDGEKEFYTEKDKPNPLNYYGYTKVLGEKIVQKTLDNFIIVRPIWVFDLGYDKRNFLVQVLTALREEDKMNVVSDQYANPILARNIARATEELIKKDKRGIYNLAGRDRMSKYEWAVKIAEAFDLDTSLLSPVSTRDLDQAAKRPVSSALDISKAENELETKLLSLEESFKLLKNL